MSGRKTSFGIRWRLLSLIIGLISLLLLVFTWSRINTDREIFQDAQKERERLLYNNLEERGRSLSRNLKPLVEEALVSNDLVNMDRTIRNAVKTGSDLEFAILVKREGTILLHTRDPDQVQRVGSADHDRQALAFTNEEKVGFINYNEAGSHYLEAVVPLKVGTENWGVLRLAINQAQLTYELALSEQRMEQQLDNVIVTSLFTALLFILIGSLVVSVAAQHFILDPLIKLKHSATAIAQGDLEAPIASGGRDELGELARAFDSMRDGIRNLIEDLENANRLKDEFLANTSLELRTPLDGMIGIAETMRDGAGPLSPGQSSNLSMIITSGKRLADLVDDLADFSNLRYRRLELNRKAVDIYSVTEVVFTLFRSLTQGKNVQLVNSVPAGLSAVDGDEERILQIMQNLIINAIRFTNQGMIEVAAEQEDNTVRVIVADTGAGIDAGRLDQLFVPFGQRQDALQGVAGLGLPLTRQLVELHGGTISVESWVGHGSRFTFTLPCSQETAEKTTINRAGSLKDPGIFQSGDDHSIRSEACMIEGAPHILIVDDERVNQALISNHLTKHCYRLSLASNGTEALQLLEADRFDLVLLDIVMPGMSGFEVCRKIRERFSSHVLPVIFLTSKNQVKDLVSAFDTGANDFITKPVAREELLSRVRTHLELLDHTRNLEQKVAERTRELHERNEELETFDRIVRVINNASSNKAVLEALVEQSLVLFPASRATFWIWDPDSKGYRAAATSGYDIKQFHHFLISREDFRQGASPHAIPLARGFFLVRDQDELKRLQSLKQSPDFDGIQALMVMFVYVEERLDGVLFVESYDHPHVFDGLDVQTLDRFYDHTVTVIIRSRLINALEQRNQQLQTKNREILETQNQLVLNEKMATLGTLTAGIAHEFNNPNNFIYGGAQLLASQLAGYRAMLLSVVNEEEAEMTDFLTGPLKAMEDELVTIREGSQRINELVKDLRNFTNFEEVDEKDTDILLGLRTIVHLIRSQYPNVDFRLEIGDPLHRRCFPAELNQAYMNVILNGCEAIADRRKVEGADAPGTLIISSRRVDDQAIISFKDSGCGIASEHQEKIFEAFFTTRSEAGKHNGLGLFTAWQTAKKHGGRIEVVSTPGEGSTFAFHLPMPQTDHNPVPPPEALP